MGLPQVRDPAGGGADLAGDGHGPAEEPQVQGGLAAVHADLEHVVLFGHHLPLADRVGPVAQLGHHVERVGDDDQDRLWGALHHRGGDLTHDLGVGADQVVPAHPRLAGQP